MNSKILTQSARGGFSTGKLLALVIAVGVIGGGIWLCRDFLQEEEKKVQQEKYYKAKKADFLVTVKLHGRLTSTEVEEIKCDVEGTTTIESIVEEGITVKGPSHYSIQSGDTLAIVAESTTQDVLDEDELNIRSLNIKLMNEDEKIDWDKELPEGHSIMIPGDLLVVLDPMSLKERINQMEITVQNSENHLSRSVGNMEAQELTAALNFKIAENNLKVAENNLEQLKNDTVPNRIKEDEGKIANLEKDVVLADKNLKAYNELKELGFVSDVEVLRTEASRAKTVHNIETLKTKLAAYKKYDQINLIDTMALDVEAAKVSIKRAEVKNIADLRDANATITTQKKTLELENERLEDLNEQMAATRIYAPADGRVIYYPGRYESFGPIEDGAKVHKGRKLIKLPRTNSLKVELNVPAARRDGLERGMKAWVQVNDVTVPGTLSVLGSNVDTNKRGHTDKSYFKGEITIDTVEFPDAFREGVMAVVEIKVKNLVGDEQRIKVPNQCVTTRMISEDTTETGCWVLDSVTKKHAWRPVDIEYSDEKFIAIKKETDPGRGLKEGELVHLSPLTEAENLNLEEGVVGKGYIEFKEGKPAPAEEKEEDADKTDKDSVSNTKAPVVLLSLEKEQEPKWQVAKDDAKVSYGEVMRRMKAKEISDGEAKAAIEKAGTHFRESVKKFLTKDQLKKFDKHMKADARVLLGS